MTWLDVVAQVVAALGVLVALRRLGRGLAPRRRPASRAAPMPPPEQLARLERAVSSGTRLAADAHLRLRPVLRRVAASRLRRHGVVLDADSAGAERALGRELYELVRADRPAPADALAPGIDISRLEADIARLEAL